MIKYFSMFSGIGGFEYGIEKATKNNHPLPSAEKSDKAGIGEESEGRGERTSTERGRIGVLSGFGELAGDRNDNLRSEQRNDSTGPTELNNITNEPLKWECVGYSEIDRYAISVYRKHYPNHINFGDATRIKPEELPDFDLLCGGFPCQAFSTAGKRRGFDDTRGTLFFEIARIVEAKRPAYLLLENVKGLLNHDKGRTFAVIIETLGRLGYDVQWVVLNSKFFGVPQNRERVFIIGNLRGQPRPQILPFGKGYRETETAPQQVSTTITAGDYKLRGNQQYINRERRAGYRVYDIDGISTTLCATGGGGEGKNTGLYNINGNSEIRRLTPTECERLQGFPDGWTSEGINEKDETGKISDSQRYKMLGNAVTTNVIEAVVRRINESNEN